MARRARSDGEPVAIAVPLVCAPNSRFFAPSLSGGGKDDKEAADTLSCTTKKCTAGRLPDWALHGITKARTARYKGCHQGGRRTRRGVEPDIQWARFKSAASICVNDPEHGLWAASAGSGDEPSRHEVSGEAGCRSGAGEAKPKQEVDFWAVEPDMSNASAVDCCLHPSECSELLDPMRASCWISLTHVCYHTISTSHPEPPFLPILLAYTTFKSTT